MSWINILDKEYCKQWQKMVKENENRESSN